MVGAVDKIKVYLKEALGQPPNVRSRAVAGLPIYLRDAYAFHTLSIFGLTYLLMIPTASSLPAASTIAKHREQLLRRQDLPVCLGFDRISSDERRRLVEKRVPFIAANKQLFLLPLGIEFNEHFARFEKRISRELSPAAQVLLFAGLYDPNWFASANAEMFAARLRYTTMTISRAARELAQHNLVVINSMGKHRALRLTGSAKEIWQRAQEHLRSPVRSRVFGKSQRDAPPGKVFRAGESSLAAHTMLASSDTGTVAVSAKLWAKVKKTWGFEEVQEAAEGLVVVELWQYDPAILTEYIDVDPLSLLVSFKDADDERLQMAVKQFESETLEVLGLEKRWQ